MRLLLVEDDTVLVQSLRKSLQQAGYAVDLAENGIDAEYLGDENIYDVVVLDLGLPQRSGLEV
ncbi:MAG: response regulator, partial [Gammaproteobacteria bacterium]